MTGQSHGHCGSQQGQCRTVRSTCCSGTAADKRYQTYPTSGPLAQNTDPKLDDLRRMLRGVGGTVYCYVMTTVKHDGNYLQQTGCGPNVEGGRITLCTCKHWMRSYRPPEDWEGQWIAGITGREASAERRRYLYYLMQVGKACKSHAELFGFLEPKVRDAKLAARNTLGDVFRPCPDMPLGKEHDARYYAHPISGHSHKKDGDEWQEDIEYVGCGRRHPPLLVGTPERSFLWKTPRYTIEGAFRQRCYELTEFLSSVRES